MLAPMNRSPWRGIPWTSGQRTGGELDKVFDTVRSQVPDVVIERLIVTHTADDDNVYFIGDASGLDLVQIASAQGGSPPFLIEGIARFETLDAAAASSAVVAEITSGGVRRG